MSDVRSDELFAVALSGDWDSDDAWKAVSELQLLGTQAVLERAIALTSSENAYYRARGADILGQLGVKSGTRSTSFIQQRLKALLDLLQRETDPLPLSSAISALGHVDELEGIEEILRFRHHPSVEVRWHVASALRGRDKPEIVETLIELMQDSEPTIRDWATFGLGTQTNADSDHVREALLQRTTDIDQDTREEAIYGLAKRKDQRAIAPLLIALGEPEYGSRMIEAASELLDHGPDDQELTASEYIDRIREKYTSPSQSP